MKKTNWTDVIVKLEKQGFTQIELGELSELGQGTISLLKSGNQKRTHYDAGKVLVGLMK